MSGPDRIWIEHHEAVAIGGSPEWLCLRATTNPNRPQDVEYVRRDPAVLAALPEVQALIAGAFEAAAKLALPGERGSQVDPTEFAAGCRHNGLRLNAAIRAMTPAAAIRKRGEGQP